MINLTNSGVNRILPKSQWGPEIKPLELTDETYKILVAAMENILRRLLTSLNYDSITNFMQFHDYTQNVDVADSSVYELYQRFRPTIYRPSSTCVGLTLELLRRWQCLRFIFPGLIWAMAPLSCEESGPNIQHDAKITSGAHELYIPDKEHLLAGVHVRLHTRAGLLLSDPGYHVARIVTVMLDKEHPHTGEFQQVNEQGSRKFYEYTFCDTNSGYVLWQEQDYRPNGLKISDALIYANRPYCDGITFSEKRNIIYKFKSIVRRSHTGLTLAGMSFCLNPIFSKAKFSIFVQDRDNENKRLRKRISFKRFLHTSTINKQVKQCIDICNKQLQLPKGKLFSIICQLAKILSDENFVRSCLLMSYYIQECSI